MSKAIFITGAASGIGRATALLFARRGWFVGLYDVNREGLESLRREIGEGRSTHGVLDVTDIEAFRRAVESFGAASGGKMDAFFQSAGVLDMGLFSDVPHQRAMRMIDINVKGVVNGVYAALPLLEKTPGSVMVTMGSASAVYGTPEFAVYCATKFFVRGLTEALDIELRKKRVRVVDVMPLYVDTPMVNDASHKARSMSTLGVKLKAEDVAEHVLAAVEAPVRGAPHVIPQVNVRLLRTLSGLIPSSGRTIQRFFARL
ncbi:MAG TPA: SDR family oxidoreductase [Polyangiaceae bacterium]|nr:SDR family oxidoreductase [Polyangiaceae bacterium]